MDVLRFVAGITERTALNIVSHRNEKGSFRSRTQVLEVAGIGPKTFEQAAGFYASAMGTIAGYDGCASGVLPGGGTDCRLLDASVAQLIHKPNC